MKCQHSDLRSNTDAENARDEHLRNVLQAFEEPPWRKHYRGDHRMQVWRQMWLAEGRKRTS